MDGPKLTSEQVKSGLTEEKVGRPYSLSVSKFGAKFARNYFARLSLFHSHLYLNHVQTSKNNYENTTDEKNLHGN